MARKSRFINGVRNIHLSQRKFEQWLLSNNYQAVSDYYPAAIEAISLVNEFLEEQPELKEHKELIIAHAEAIGFISDYMDEEMDEEEFN